MITRRLAVVVAGAMVILSACSSNPSAPAGGSGAAATGCTVGVSWNNYSQERWKKADEPAMQKAIAAGGGSYIRADANDKAEGPDRAGQGRQGHPARDHEGQDRGHPGHRL
jgi:hypothetical protein